MPAPARADLKVVTGSTTLELTLKPDSLVFGTAEPLNPIVNQTAELDYRSMNPKQGITWDINDFTKGLGPFEWKQGHYFYSRFADCRSHLGVFRGPSIVADLTGIAANERVIKRIEVGADNWIITTTTVYRSTSGTGNWTQVGANGTGWVAGNPTDIVCFGVSGGNPIIAVAMGASTAYQYTVDNGTNWVTSTKTAGNAKYADFFCVAARGGTAPKVWYVRNQNELYSTFDLTNSDPTGTTDSSIGDAVNDDFTSITEDKNGVLLVGTIHALWTIDDGGVVTRLTPFYQHKATSDVGAFTSPTTRATNRNFENPVEIDGRIYYPLEDYRIGEWDANAGTWTDGIQPSAWGDAPVLSYPLTCMGRVGNELMVGLGSTSATLKSTTFLPGLNVVNGNMELQGWSLYSGRRNNDGTWTWHGALLYEDSSVIARYLWYDDRTKYLYIPRAAQALINVSQVRCRFFTASELSLYSGTWAPGASYGFMVETGIFYASQPNVTKTLRFGVGRASFYGSGVTFFVRYRIALDNVATDYVTLDDYTSSADVAAGTAVTTGQTFTGIRLEFNETGTLSATNPILFHNYQAVYHLYPARYDDITFTVTAARGQVNRSGAMQGLTMSQVKAALEGWRDSTDPATITDTWTGDTWAMNLDRIEMRGTGKQRTFVCTGHEVR